MEYTVDGPEVFAARRPQGTACGQVGELAVEGGAGLLYSQMRQLLGPDGELDSSFLEHSWRYGLPAALEDREDRMRRKSRAPEPGVPGYSFANSDCFRTPVIVRIAEHFAAHPYDRSIACPSHAPASAPGAAYRAGWLHEPGEASGDGMEDENSASGPAMDEDAVTEQAMPHPMTQQHACRLLHVSLGSTGAQIKAAYRGMVSQWHPDRLGQAGEEARRRANDRLAAINEAYSLLRGALGGSISAR